MLKITVSRDSHLATIKLEGRLSGPWVGELERTWRDLVRDDGVVPAQVDLTDVTFISAEGKGVLGEMYRQGAEFRAGALMQLTLEGIRNAAKRP